MSMDQILVLHPEHLGFGLPYANRPSPHATKNHTRRGSSNARKRKLRVHHFRHRNHIPLLLPTLIHVRHRQRWHDGTEPPFFSRVLGNRKGNERTPYVMYACTYLSDPPSPPQPQPHLPPSPLTSPQPSPNSHTAPSPPPPQDTPSYPQTQSPAANHHACTAAAYNPHRARPRAPRSSSPRPARPRPRSSQTGPRGRRSCRCGSSRRRC